MSDIAFPPLQRFDFGGVDVQTENTHARARELQRERQAHVAQADDANFHFCPCRTFPLEVMLISGTNSSETGTFWLESRRRQ